jgi:hypothetical protein
MEMKENKTPDLTIAPDTPAYYTLYAYKFDFDCARNALLYFIEEKGLSKKCAEWLDKHWPRED